MRANLEEYCIRRGKPEILAQWDAARNAPLTPEDIPHSSREKVWWRCERGHAYRASIQSRVIMGSGCPVCAGKTVQPGWNDLLSKRPEIAAEWDAERNVPLTPDAVAAGSGKAVWWRCPEGHSYRAPVAERTRAKTSGCPYCAKRLLLPGVNDPKTRNPALAAEWDAARNGDVRMETLLNSSTYKAWWLCPGGHSYQASVRNRVYNKTGCPYCTGKKALAGYNDLGFLRPELAAQWDAARNAPLTPETVTLGSGRRVWWRCSEGHSWQTAVFNRVNGSTGCPVCRARKTGPDRRRFDAVLADHALRQSSPSWEELPSII